MFLHFARSLVGRDIRGPGCADTGGCAGVTVVLALVALSVIRKQPSPIAAAAVAVSIHLIIRFVIRFAPRLIDQLALPRLNEAMLATRHGSCGWKSDRLETPCPASRD
jgi:hypothetical protein